MMRRRCALVLTLLLAGARMALALDTTQLADPALQARYVALTHELRCMQCQNESIADSPVDLAADLRNQVREQLLAGRSDDEVRAWMAARYGDFILFRPRFSARTAWIWLAPGALLVLGGIVGWRIIGERTRLLTDDPDRDDEDLNV
jgi:cytochrome c-type biogenesis protein CcmH